MSVCLRLNVLWIGLMALVSTAFAQERSDSFAIDPTRGIDERMFLDIRGVPQHVIIRGENRSNPVLLYLHGGPGAAASLYAWKFFTRGGWEREFTIVHWDQPGAGKTFARAGHKVDPQLTIERVAEDGIAVSEAVARKMGQRKVILVGGSWGSAIGVKMALMRPDLFHAYVGMAQIVSKPEDEALAYQRVLEKAKRKGNQAAIAELEKAGSPPYATASAFRAQRKWAVAYEKLPAIDIQKEVRSTPGTVPEDLQVWWQGFLASEAHFRGDDMRGPLTTLDLRRWGTRFALPVLFIQGTEDDVTPTHNVQQYFEMIEAPRKQLLLIEGAGHNAVITRPEEIVRLLRTHVAPLAR